MKLIGTYLLKNVMRNIYKYMCILALLMHKKDLYLLLYLAEKTKLHQPLQASTGAIAADLRISQQTVSRKLIAFVHAGLIERTLTQGGVEIRLAPAGKKLLHRMYGDLQRLFGQQLSLRGTVKDGLGEGRFYMSQNDYIQQFLRFFHFTPFAGTLNLTVASSAVDAFLSTKQYYAIHGFTTKERSFGGLHCYPVHIAQKIAGVLIIPERTLHKPDTIEVVAPMNLREALQLQNGHEVEMT